MIVEVVELNVRPFTFRVFALEKKKLHDRYSGVVINQLITRLMTIATDTP